MDRSGYSICHKNGSGRGCHRSWIMPAGHPNGLARLQSFKIEYIQQLRIVASDQQVAAIECNCHLRRHVSGAERSDLGVAGGVEHEDLVLVLPEDIKPV